MNQLIINTGRLNVVVKFVSSAFVILLGLEESKQFGSSVLFSEPELLPVVRKRIKMHDIQ